MSDETREPEAKGPEGTDSETGGQTSGADGPSSGANGSEEQGRSRNARDRVSEGFSRGLGVLSAFKEALEETISEARERGDLSVERAREAMKGAVGRAREATSDARERFDFVSQADFDTLVQRVRELEERMDAWESAPEGDATGEP